MDQSSRSRNRRDYYAGALMMLIGCAAVYAGQRYGVGTPTRMGPGFFPVSLGMLMSLIGVLIAVNAIISNDHDDEYFLPKQPEWLGWACIVASPIAFIVLGIYGGMLPATVGCIFIAAMGDKQMTIKQAVALSMAVSATGVLIFHYLLKVSFPVIRGVWQ
jgi:hypothetical protein